MFYMELDVVPARLFGEIGDPDWQLPKRGV